MSRRKITETRVESVNNSKETCRHYWVIESAKGPVSKGVCKFCGAQKEFHNSWPYFPVGKPAEKVPEIAGEAGGQEEELE